MAERESAPFNVSARLARIEGELNELETRIRTVEAVDSPEQRRTVQQIADLKAKVDRMRELDTNTNLVALTGLVKEIRDEQKGMRFLVKSALITAGLSVFCTIVAAAILKATVH